jgi:hypothetical protein
MMSFETGNICSFKKTKISIKEITKKVFQWVNISYSEKDPNIAIVIGRDRTFGLSRQILRIPMLFVGINDPDNRE